MSNYEIVCDTCGNKCAGICAECKFYDGIECHQEADECRNCLRGDHWTPEQFETLKED